MCVLYWYLFAFLPSHSLTQQTGWLVYMRGISTLLFALDERKCNPGSSLCRQACYLTRLLSGAWIVECAADVYGTPTRAQMVKGNFVVCTRAHWAAFLAHPHPLISFFRIPARRVNVHIKAPDWLNSILLNGWKALCARWKAHAGTQLAQIVWPSFKYISILKGTGVAFVPRRGPLWKCCVEQKKWCSPDH